MLQMVVVGMSGRSLRLPTRIRSVSVDPLVHAGRVCKYADDKQGLLDFLFYFHYFVRLGWNGTLYFMSLWSLQPSMSMLTDALIPLLLVESRLVAYTPLWPHADSSSRVLQFSRSLCLFPMWKQSASQPMGSLLKNLSSAKVHQKLPLLILLCLRWYFSSIISNALVSLSKSLLCF